MKKVATTVIATVIAQHQVRGAGPNHVIIQAAMNISHAPTMLNAQSIKLATMEQTIAKVFAFGSDP